jgi:hypothetical protein
MRRWNREHGMQPRPRRRPPEVLREVGGLGEALEEVVEEAVEVVEAPGVCRRSPKACLVNFRCKVVEACLLARLRCMWL